VSPHKVSQGSPQFFKLLTKSHGKKVAEVEVRGLGFLWVSYRFYRFVVDVSGSLDVVKVLCRALHVH